ncbi:MAG: exodeoxyribonuclease VII small subunit [Chthoniobacter sp.]|nr:exodeoxyribonuclease VII small subunit [Chthoniobacter sp.]
MSAKSTEPTPSFEAAIGRLEAVVEEMGSDNLPLEDLIKLYEEGVRLIKVCEQKLGAVEKRVEILMDQTDGDAVLAPFDPEKKAVAGPREDVSLF